MWQRKSVSVLTLGFFLFAVSALRGDDFSDKIVGTWKAKENFAGYELRTTVTKEGDQWSIKGTFEKDGSVAGMRLAAGSGDVALDRAAWGGVTASNPFPPLPGEFSGQYLALRFHFYYNPERAELR